MQLARNFAWILTVAFLLPGAGKAVLEPRPPQPFLLLETDGLADGVDPCGVFGSLGDVTFLCFFESDEAGTPGWIDDDTLRVRLWRSDGTPGGTFPLLSPEHSYYYAKDTLDGVLFFAACHSEDPGPFVDATPCASQSTRGIWRTDGSLEGTFPLLEERGSLIGFSGTEVVPELGLVFFLVLFEPEAGWELWATDGTESGTRLVKALAPLGYVFSGGLTSFGGELHFVVKEKSADARTWIGYSDGTPEGTSFSPAPFDGEILVSSLRSADNRLFLLGSGPEEDPTFVPGTIRKRMTLWSKDTREESWRPAGDLGFWPVQTNTWTVAGRGRAFVRVDNLFDDVSALWGSDGTVGSGELLADLPPFRSFGLAISTEALALPKGKAFIRLPHEIHGSEPWISDGTASGTTMLADLCPGECSSHPTGIGPGLGGSYLFTALDDVNGRALWRWRPTTGEVERIVDLCPAECPGSPRLVARAGDRLYFAGPDAAGVSRLWEVDERRSLIRPVADLGEIRIDRFSVLFVTTSVEWDLAGDRWVFWGQDPDHGLALWSLHLPTPATSPPPGPTLTSDELAGFAVKVRIGGEGGIDGRAEPGCIPETLCVSGALPGRSEVFVRVVGPKPNGKLWPTLVKFTTSTVEVWIEQLATGVIRYYRLEGATPGSSDLPGLFDRDGFSPPG